MSKEKVLIGVAALFILVFWGCREKIYDLEGALASIKADELSQNTQILASDEFEGRAPSSKGEEVTVNFLQEQFKKLGLEPGNGDSFFQEVPMIGINSIPEGKFEIKGNGKTTSLSFGDEFTAVTLRVQEEVALEDSEMVFVGYGIISPEYNWNDYEGIDVKGKTVVMLVNDPGFTTKDPKLFSGNAMTYYGRWTYKYEEAARQGAAGAFIVHETEPAAYGWGVVRKGWTGLRFILATEDRNLSRCAVEGWLTLEVSKRLLETVGQDFGALKAEATIPGFKSIPLGLKASLKLINSLKQTSSKNVIAVWPGSDRIDEYIFYMAHWDHFGIDPTQEGDQIFNGALDNATGTSGLIELAEAFKKLGSAPRRSIAFLAVTGEEQGLLGSLYYSTHPIYPLEKTVAVINMDSLNIYGKMKDITIIGYGKSELDDYVETAAAEQGRRVEPNPTPEKGSFYRSDHFTFAKQGIPALYTSSGNDHFKHGSAWTLEQKEKYQKEKYHKPSDEFDAGWDLSGAIDDLRLLFKIGFKLSMESTFPNWREGTEFKARRDADMQKTVSK